MKMHKSRMITQIKMTALLFQMFYNGNLFLEIGFYQTNQYEMRFAQGHVCTISHNLTNMRNLQQRYI